MALFGTPRGSFRQALLFAFLLITALVVGAALHALYQFDTLMTQSREAAARALTLSGAVRSLAEHSASMERSARQSLVFNDVVLRGRATESAKEAGVVLDRLGEYRLPELPSAQWTAQLGSIEKLMNGAPTTALDRERQVAQEFRDLDRLNAVIARQVQTGIETQNAELEDRMAAARARLVGQVIGASALAVVLALAFGVWLSRPFQQMERAIVGLGENRLTEAIDIRGPADVRRLAQRLDWLRLRLTELDADKARFLRHISHELKTPLAALREGVSLLEDDVMGTLNADQREVAHILQQNTLSLQSQIEALLRFNSAAFEARRLERAPTELIALLDDQVELQRLQWQAQGLRVRVEGEPLTVTVDPAKLATAFANLLSNAIRFSSPGGTVRLAVSSVPGLARIDIRDDGPGIDAEEAVRIFEPFFRGGRQPDHAVRGTGIGLSIVQEYVAAHGGTVTSLPSGRGAHFRVELPHNG